MAMGRPSYLTKAKPTGWAMDCSICSIVRRCSGLTGLWAAKASTQAEAGLGEISTAGSAGKPSYKSLYAWAWEKGARFAYLQVVATNAAAMPLYAAQGFRTVYEYEYLVPPTP